MGKWQKDHPVKKIWTVEEEDFIRNNWQTKTNAQLASALGMKLTSLRTKLYEMGFKRMEMEYWTDEQVEFLKANFRTIGDSELANMFNDMWEKEKGWTLKHIEKKRKYLKLNRTKNELAAIKQRNVDNGCFAQCAVKRWITTGQAEEGEIRMWREDSGRMVPFIKINGKFRHWNRWAWEKFKGPIPEKMNVCFKDNNPQNASLENLVLKTDAQLSIQNARQASTKISDNWLAGVLTPHNKELRQVLKNNPSFLEAKRQSIILNRKINEQQKKG